jgi:Uncharacterized conserved protein
MELRIAKEFIHIKGWLDRAQAIVVQGEAAYFGDVLLQEAGDSIMMKLGEAARRLQAMDVVAPEGIEWSLAVANRNFIIHQYDEISRPLTWETLSVDLPQWRTRLHPLITQARSRLELQGD